MKKKLAIKQCMNCRRWKSPTRESACRLDVNDYENTQPFKSNGDGSLYCDDFKAEYKADK